MAWQPQEDALRQLCELFKDALQGNQPDKQQRATAVCTCVPPNTEPDADRH